MFFVNRIDAGRRLAERLRHLGPSHPVVLGLPRGGVPVAREVAAALHAPLDVLVVRKLGAPVQPELALGAITTAGMVVDWRLARQLGVSREEVEAIAAREREELASRERRYRGGRPAPAVEGRTVIVVDDGLATGATSEAAVRALRPRGPARIVLAVPVGSPSAVDRLSALADEVVCLDAPGWFMAVGEFYEDFSPTTDEEVEACLATNATS
jgi:predicted phosphoribosyltransferase